MRINKYLKSAFKHISHNPMNSTINILGLGLGVGVFVLIMLYVNHQKSYDNFHENLDKIYRVEGALGGITAPPFYPYFSEKLPQISKGSRIIRVDDLLNYTQPGDDNIKPGLDARIYAVDTTFFEIFTYPLVSGSVKDLMGSSNHIAITQEIADKLFGDVDPINKSITYGSGELTVKAVLEDIPSNTSLPFDAIKPINYKDVNDNDWGRWYLETYFVIEQQFDVESVEDKMDDLNRKRYIEAGRENPELPYNFNLRPYKDIYFCDLGDYHEKGKESHIMIFTMIAIFVLLIACINYINLSTASASQRLKELALRKMNGASRKDIIYQILSESVLLAFISILLAILIIEFSLPYFRSLTDKEIYLHYTPHIIFLLFVFAPLFLGLLAGIYPAVYISKFNVLEVLKGKWVFGKSGAVFRKTLTIAQFSISIFLIIGTMFVYRQLQYLQNFDPGYEKEQVISLTTNGELRKHFDSFKERLLKLPSVKGVTQTNTYIHNVGSVMSAYYDKSVSTNEDAPTVGILLVDEDFLDFFDVRLIKGRKFTESMARGDKQYYLINEEFARIFPSDTVLHQTINNNEVIGIVEDIRTRSLYNEQQPFAISLTNSERAYLAYVKINSENYGAALDDIRNVWNEFVPQYPFNYEFLDESFMQMYKDDVRFGKAFLIFSILSILIACLGLFALVSFATEKKTKEIGIRKVMGATSSNVVFNLVQQFTLWVILANIIAWPVAYYFLQNWVQNFNQHVKIHILYFLIAALISFFIALFTILFKATRAANANPVNSLRYE